jgi:hypothetical protein
MSASGRETMSAAVESACWNAVGRRLGAGAVAYVKVTDAGRPALPVAFAASFGTGEARPLERVRDQWRTCGALASSLGEVL